MRKAPRPQRCPFSFGTTMAAFCLIHAGGQGPEGSQLLVDELHSPTDHATVIAPRVSEPGEASRPIQEGNLRWSTLAMFAAVPACARSTAVPGRITDRAPAGPTYAYVDGSWFDGQRFVAKPMYSVAGVLTDRAPAVIDSSLNLAGGFVVPPFG